MQPTWVKRMGEALELPPGTLSVTEVFASIQGESSWAGLPCTMVRLAGCNLRCRYCDTAHAFTPGRSMAIAAIVQAVAAAGLQLVEVTGGEPLAQAGTLDLLAQLCDAGYTVLLETSGSLDVSPVDPRVFKIVDIKAPSSGECDANLWSNLESLQPHDELKLVLSDRSDYDWAKELLNRHDLLGQRTIHFAPAWQVLPIETLAQWILADRLAVRLQPQLHKLLSLP